MTEQESAEAIFTEERGEKQYYENADEEATICVPLTKDGFESLLKQACDLYELPLNDSMRLALIAQLHHIEAGCNETSIGVLADALHRAVSNAMTWKLDQEIKEKRRKLAKKEAEKIAKENSTEDNKVLPLQ